jgi:5-methylcytosine-specific restriction endonuclease McrA
VRLFVLNRDKWVCQLCGKPIDPKLRPPHPGSASVHHTRGKRYGDDPEQLVAAHRKCNQDAGEPGASDPQPISATRW